MNKIDKLIAQENGREAKLPPFHKYIITFEPQSDKFIKIKKEDNRRTAEIKNKNAITSFLGLRKEEEVKQIPINMEYLTFEHNIYYDDPEETEEERLKILDSLDYGDQGYRESISDRIKLYEPQSNLTFKRVIKKLDYSYKPLSEQIESETAENNESISEPTKGFMQKVKHFITQ